MINVDDKHLSQHIRVQGIDAGGLRREFYSKVSQEIFSELFGVFGPCGSRNEYCWFLKYANVQKIEAPQPATTNKINKTSGSALCVPKSNADLEALGKLIALAMYNDIVLTVNFPRAFYSMLLGEEVRKQY